MLVGTAVHLIGSSEVGCFQWDQLARGIMGASGGNGGQGG